MITVGPEAFKKKRDAAVKSRRVEAWDNQFGTTAPRNLEQLMPCEGVGTGDPNDGALTIAQFLDTSNHPGGRDFKATPEPAGAVAEKHSIKTKRQIYAPISGIVIGIAGQRIERADMHGVGRVRNIEHL